jgi:hypothetical protein
MGKDNNPWPASRIVRRRDNPSGSGSNPEDLEVAAADVFHVADFHTPRPRGPKAGAQIVAAGEDSVENLVEVAIGTEKGICAAVGTFDPHQAIRLACRNGPQQKLIDKAKKGRGQA